MLSPWIILAAVLAIAAAGTGGYFKGSTDAENKTKAEYAKQLDGVIAQHNKDSLSDMQEAAAMATREAQAKTRTIYVRQRADAAVAEKPSSVLCDLTPARMIALKEAVKLANGDIMQEVNDKVKASNEKIIGK